MAISSQIKSKILEVVFSVIEKDSTTVILFGSHASGTANNFSDIDIGLKSSDETDLDGKISSIRAALSESNIPYKIDVVNFDRAEQDFLAIALKEHVIWHKPK